MYRMILWILAVLAAFSPAAAAAEYEISSSVTVGYNFLFSAGDNPFYRSHRNLREGLVVDDFHLILQAKPGEHFFDRFTAEACLAGRLDSQQGFRFSLEKYGRFKATVRYAIDDDYFWNPLYNYGSNYRDLSRRSLEADFSWSGVRHFVFNFGYRHGLTEGEQLVPAYYWGDILKLVYDKHWVSEEFRAGLIFSRNGFTAGFQQSWVAIKDQSAFSDRVTAGAGLSIYDLLFRGGERAGSAESRIPVSTVQVSCTKDRWSTGFSYHHRDGRLDNDLLDVRKIYFEGRGTWTDFAYKTAGRTEVPEDRVDFHLTFQPHASVELGYTFFWNSLESSTRQHVDQSMSLYLDPAFPVTTTDEADYSLLYRNRYQQHTASLIYTPLKDLSLTAAYRHRDGNITWNGVHPYGSNRIEAGVKYRFRTGTEAGGSVALEKSTDPFYPNQAGNRREYQLNAYHPFGDRLSASLNYRYSKQENSSIQLDNGGQLLNFNIEYRILPWIQAGGGLDWFNLNCAQLFQYSLNQVYQSVAEEYDTSQTMVFAFLSFAEKHRLSGRIILNYLTDDGGSMPFSGWNPGLDVQLALTKGLHLVAAGRYFNYHEVQTPVLNYSLNQLTMSLCWKF